MPSRSRKKQKQNMVAVMVIILVIAMVLGMAFLIGGNGVNTGNSVPLQNSGTQEEQIYLSQLAVNPNDYNALAGLGNYYYDRGDYVKAIAYYERALAIRATDPGLLVDTGTAYYYRQPSDPDTALTYYEKALNINPNFPNAIFNQGVVTYDGKRDLIKARGYFVRFIQQFPSSPQAGDAKEIIATIDRELGAPGR